MVVLLVNYFDILGVTLPGRLSKLLFRFFMILFGITFQVVPKLRDSIESGSCRRHPCIPTLPRSIGADAKKGVDWQTTIVPDNLSIFILNKIYPHSNFRDC